MYRSPFVAASYETTPFKKKGSWKCGYHTGVDRVSNINTVLVAIGDGKVESVNACGSSYGYHCVLRIGGYSVLYAHMRATPLVKTGATVKTGEPLGYMGNTGNSSGAHLHIEIQNGSRWAYASNLVNPNSLIDWNKFTNSTQTQTSTSTKKEGESFMAKTWKNGSTPEKVYQTVQDCKNKKKSIGKIAAREMAQCLGITDGCYVVEYQIDGGKKVGYVAYSGGVK